MSVERFHYLHSAKKRNHEKYMPFSFYNVETVSFKKTRVNCQHT